MENAFTLNSLRVESQRDDVISHLTTLELKASVILQEVQVCIDG